MKFKDCPNNKFIGFCVVRKASIRHTSAGKPYADLQVYDGAEQIMGRIWDYDGELPKESTVIKVEGVLLEYNGSPQITISRFRDAKEDEYDKAEFIPTYPGDRNDLQIRLQSNIGQIQTPSIRIMVKKIYEDFKAEYFDAPAAVFHHHNYLGGLLEHTLSVTRIALTLSSSQKQPVNTDLIIAGAVLHDIGKIQAYSLDCCAIEYSMDGKMIDHIPLGMMILKPYVDKYLDHDTAQHLLHIIASHHGLKEWGSPVEPSTQEAKIVHLADLVDARLNAN